MIVDIARLAALLPQQPYPLAFISVYGDHLYGIASTESPFRLHGAHVLPPQEVMGLYPKREALEVHREVEGIQIDLVTHDILKFMGTMLKPNGYALEQLTSPLVVHTSQVHDALRALVPGCVTRNHVHHYLGFACNQWELLNDNATWRIKPLLYVYRVLLTGIHLMKTGRIEANLVHLNETFKLPYIPDLIAGHVEGADGAAGDIDKAFHQAEYERLLALLERAGERSRLPDGPSCAPEMNTLLLRLRGLRS